MKDVKAVRGVTANTSREPRNKYGFTEREVEAVIADLLNSLKEQSPKGKGTMRNAASKYPTYLPDGYRYQSPGNVPVAWTEPKSGNGRMIAGSIMILSTGLFMLSQVSVTVPAIFLVAPWLIPLCVWILVKRYRHPGNRADCHRCTTQEAAQRPARRTVDTYPRQAPYSETERIGDTERDQVTRELGIHLGAGRMTMDEFEIRSSQATQATNHRELIPVLNDLPFLTIDERRLP